MSSGKRVRSKRTSDVSRSSTHDRKANPPRRSLAQSERSKISTRSNRTTYDSDSEDLFRYPKQRHTKEDSDIDEDFDLELDETFKYALDSLYTDEDYESNGYTTDNDNDISHMGRMNQLRKLFENMMSEQNRISDEVTRIKQQKTKVDDFEAPAENKRLELEMQKTRKDIEWVKTALANSSMTMQSQTDKVRETLEQRLREEQDVQKLQQQQIAKMKEQIDQLNDLIHSQSLKLDQERSNDNDQFQRLQKEIEHKDIEMSNLCAMHEQVLKELSVLREAEEKSDDTEKELIAKAKELHAQNKKQNEHLLAMRQKLNEKSTEAKQLAKTVKELKLQEQEARKEKIEVERTLTGLQKRHSDLITQCKELKQCARSMENELEQSSAEQEKKNHSLVRERVELRRQLEYSEKRVSELESDLTREKSNYTKVVEEKSTLKREVVDLKQTLKELQTDYERSQREREIRLATADELLNSKVKEVLDREMKQKEVNRELQRRLDESESQKHELEMRLLELSKTRKEENERKWIDEIKLLSASLEKERDSRMRLEKKNDELSAELITFQNEIELIQTKRDREIVAKEGTISTLQKRQSDLETRCKKLSKLVKKIYERYSHQPIVPEEKPKERQRVSAVRSLSFDNDPDDYPPNTVLDRETIEKMIRKRDEELRAYDDKMSSLLQDIGEHGKELEAVRETFLSIKESFSRDDEQGGGGRGAKKETTFSRSSSATKKAIK